jgi:hypothetical protein
MIMNSTHTHHSPREVPGTGTVDWVPELERRLDELQSRLVAVERELELLNDAQEAHIRAKRNDAREALDRGQIENLVVKEPPAKRDDDTALCRIDGIVTFLDPDGVDLKRGDLVRARISDVRQNAAHAILLEREVDR